MAKTRPCVFVVIPVFNRLKYTKECLQSLSNQKYKNIQVVLVDDGSTDGTSDFVRSEYPLVHIIKGDGNWWWTRCMYEGVAWALGKAESGDFVLEMNNDCYFGPNYVSQILNTSKKYKNHIIGSLCVMSQDENEVVEAGIRINWKTGLVFGVAPAVSSERAYFERMTIVDKLDALPGKGTLIPIEVFQKVGSFDYKHLPHYIADYEFANRAQRAGFKLIVDTHALVLHHWDATGLRSHDLKSLFSYQRAWQIMFGRRSMNNLIDWLNFLFLACPREYLALNLYTTFWRTVYGATKVFPLTFFRPVVPLFPKAIAAVYCMVVRIRKYLIKLFKNI